MTRAEERFPKDYQALSTLALLVRLQDQGKQELFGDLMCRLWMSIAEKTPKTPEVLILDAYFKRQGDLRKALAEHEESVAAIVGHLPHREAMDRIRANINLLDNLWKEVGR